MKGGIFEKRLCIGCGREIRRRWATMCSQCANMRGRLIASGEWDDRSQEEILDQLKRIRKTERALIGRMRTRES